MLRLHCGQELVQQLQGARPEILNRRLEIDSMNRYDGRNPLGEALADHADLLLDGQVPLNRGLKIQRPVQVKQFECCQARWVSSLLRYPGAQADRGTVENSRAKCPTAVPILWLCSLAPRKRRFEDCSGSQYS